MHFSVNCHTVYKHGITFIKMNYFIARKIMEYQSNTIRTMHLLLPDMLTFVTTSHAPPILPITLYT